VEASIALAIHCAALMDGGDPLARVVVPAAKYWVCKRQVGVVHEALEAHGGAGYVEGAPLARLFRAGPLNAVWEGSGNVIALDLLRALKAEGMADALSDRLRRLLGLHPALDTHLAGLDATPDEATARGFAEAVALAFQAEALSHGDADVFEAFCAVRLGRGGSAYGAAPVPNADHLIARAGAAPA
jgi:putative acyl-CoA dehydrogenase